MSFAKDRGMIATNPCEKGGRLYAADRTDKIWGEQEIGALLSVASPEIKLALVLALWTGQRQGVSRMVHAIAQAFRAWGALDRCCRENAIDITCRAS
jgi:hypothetical protein